MGTLPWVTEVARKLLGSSPNTFHFPPGPGPRIAGAGSLWLLEQTKSGARRVCSPEEPPGPQGYAQRPGSPGPSRS